MVTRTVEVEVEIDMSDAIADAFKSPYAGYEIDTDTFTIYVAPVVDGEVLTCGVSVDVCNELRRMGDGKVQYSMPHHDDHPDRGIAPTGIAKIEPQLVKLEEAIAYVRSLYNPNAKPVA